MFPVVQSTVTFLKRYHQENQMLILSNAVWNVMLMEFKALPVTLVQIAPDSPDYVSTHVLDNIMFVII